MKKIFFRSAFFIALIAYMPFAHSAFAVELAPTDIPSSVELDESNTPTAEGIRDASFPAVDVENPSKPSDSDGDITIIASENVTIDTKSGSDVFAAGNTVSITSPVNGDIFAAGNTIDITIPNGSVSGSVRLAGNTITINGAVKRNALIFANTVIIGADTVISGDAHIYAGRIVIDGTLAGTATLAGEEVVINGKLSDITRIDTESLVAGDDANFAGTTDVYSPNEFVADAQVEGATNITPHKTIRNHKNFPSFAALRFAMWLMSTFFFLLVGVLLIVIWPQWFERVVRTMQKYPGETWSKGALAFFITPFAAILLCFTIIGIPLAILLMIAYCISLSLGLLFTGMYLGFELVHEKRFQRHTKQRIAYFVIGYFILSFVMIAPFVGWLVKILACIWGLGGMIHSFKRKPV